MKKVLLFFPILLLGYTLRAEIHYTNYGSLGLSFPIGTEKGLDINEDGILDFYINALEDELNIKPINAIGCLTSPSAQAYNNLGTRALQIHQLGDFIEMNTDNFESYIEDDRTALYTESKGLAEGWSHQEYQYIGIGMFLPGISYAINGWAKIQVDKIAQILYIKEIAYRDPVGFGQGGITVGDKGQSTAIQIIDQLFELLIVPNPANEFVQLLFDYTGTQNLSIIIQNTIGQEIYRNNTTSFGQTNLNISTTDWMAGMYIIRFETQDGIRTEKLFINK